MYGKLVEPMDGRIGVESAPAKGRTFMVTVRFSSPSRRSGQAVRARRSGSPRILVVDDNALSRTCSSGCWTPGACNARARRGMVRPPSPRSMSAARGHLSLVLLDASMPGWTAWRSAHRLVRIRAAPRAPSSCSRRSRHGVDVAHCRERVSRPPPQAGADLRTCSTRMCHCHGGQRAGSRSASDVAS